MVIAYLIYNSPALRSCSLTCYSWYIAAVPHLHPILFVTLDIMTSRDRRILWPNPFLHMHRLGLLPLVKTIRIHSFFTRFSPKQFNCCILRQFLTLTNVQRLEVDDLDIPSFIPTVRRYFGPFLPTLQSLCLKKPKGTNQHIIFFVGLFQHLENLSLDRLICYGSEREKAPTLIPPFTPPLRGWLIVKNCKKAGFFQDMVRLFGEIRFSAVNLFGVDETRFLLRACAKTLRTLQLHPTDCLGEQL